MVSAWASLSDSVPDTSPPSCLVTSTWAPTGAFDTSAWAPQAIPATATATTTARRRVRMIRLPFAVKNCGDLDYDLADEERHDRRGLRGRHRGGAWYGPLHAAVRPSNVPDESRGGRRGGSGRSRRPRRVRSS